MQKAKKIFMYAIVTISILLFCFALLRPKDDETLVIAADFYKEDTQSIEVLFMGSSRAVMNINPAVVWETSGVKSFTYGGMGQPLWSTYHYLEEALLHQAPSVIVLEVGMISFNEEYADYNFIVKNTLGIKSLPNRYENIVASAPSDMRTDLMLDFPIYHNRFTELTMTDLTLGLVEEYKSYTSYKGFMPSANVVEFEEPVDNSADEVFEIGVKNLEYLHKIINLCKENNIELVFLATPDAITTTTNWSEMNDSIALEVSEIAHENDIPFLYCDKITEIGIDYENDFRDERHLNIWGAEKLSIFLANYLSDNYIFEYSEHSEWDEFANATKQNLGY